MYVIYHVMNDCGENFKSHLKYLVILIALLDHQKRKETCCIEFRLCLLALMTHVIVNMIFLKQQSNKPYINVSQQHLPTLHSPAVKLSLVMSMSDVQLYTVHTVTTCKHNTTSNKWCQPARAECTHLPKLQHTG